MKITISQAAVLLGVSTTTIANKIRSGELSDLGYSPHGRRMVEEEEVLRLEIMPLAIRRYLGETQRRGHARKRAEKKESAA